MKKTILILILGLFLISFISATTEYTATTDTICNDGVCTKTLYSGVRNVYEDNQWKPIEEARSLKDKGFNVITLEDDKDFLIDVVDFNYTSITVRLNPSGLSVFPNSVPVRVWTPDEAKEEQIKQDVLDGKVAGKTSLEELTYKDTMTKVKDEEVGFSLFSQTETKTYDFGMGKILEFGYNSTTIILQDADTENLDDTYISQDNADSNYGSLDDLLLRGIMGPFNNASIYIKFNISKIPNDSEIIESKLSIYQETLSSGYNYSINHVFNQTWDEEEITWNNQPCGEFLSDSDNCNSTSMDILISFATSEFISFNVFNAVSKDIYEDLNYSSFYLWVVSGGANTYSSKEHINLSQRPYLNITYSPPDTSPPSVTSLTETPTEPALSGGTYEFNATITDETGIDTVLFEFDGTNYTATNITADVYNVTLTGLSAGTYNYIWFANDTLGNVNNTESGSYTINKGTGDVKTYINGNREGYNSSSISELINVSSRFDTGVGDVLLYVNGTVWNNGTGTWLSNVSTFAVGEWNVTGYYAGNENYTSDSETWWINVSLSSSGSSYVSDTVCNSLGLGIDNVGSKIPIIMAILVMVLILGIFGILFAIFNGGSVQGLEVNFNTLIIWIMAIGGLIVTSIMALIIVSAMCSI